MSTIDYDGLQDRDAHANRPHSIDLTLELERQLEAESLPTSPAVATHPSRPQSLDPHVLASIVTQLRISLADVSKERDELASALAEVKAGQTGMKDALEHVTEKCILLEAELEAARDKNKEDGDSITMLRGKLEDSRRALMRLQTENRRNSQISNMALDLSRPGATALSGPPSAKRMSFAPLTGSPAHRRISSVSEPGVLSPPHFSDCNTTDGLSPSRRLSGFFGRPSPVQPDLPRLADASEVDELRKELQVVKDQLDEARHDLSESQEACEASETCVRALRTFISENNIGLGDSRGPGTIGSRSAASTETPTRGGTARWGFKLWTTSNPVTPVSSPALQSAAPPVTAAAAPLSKLGGLFSSRASISSTTSSRQEALPVTRELTSNGSETSSMDELVVEPISPVSEVPRPAVIVRVNSETSSDSIAYPSPPPAKERVAPLATLA